jgi:arginine:pyruvate transaminase
MRLREAGHDVIMLTVGDPDQAPPEKLIEATIAALRTHQTGYAWIIGAQHLRELFAACHQRRTGQPCTADNVTVAPGAKAVSIARYNASPAPATRSLC